MKILCAIIDRMLSAPAIETIEAVTFWPACQELGNARLFPFWRVECEIGQAQMNQQFLQTVEEFVPDIVFSVAFRDNWLPGVMNQVPCPTIVVFSDSYRSDFIQRHSPQFDVPIVMDDIGVALLPDHPGVRKSMWACNPKIHNSFTRRYRPRDLDVVFVGGTHGGKEHYIQALQDAGISVTARGRSRPGGIVSTAEYVELYQRAKIGLCFTMSADGQTPQPKARTFETAAFGCMMMHEKSPFVDDYFVPGEEYIPFGSEAELVSKVSHYLAHNKRRLQIAGNGLLRAHRDHTYVQRLTEIFGELL